MATLRHTRYQIAIIEHDQLLLIRFANASTSFWLLPGGGREPHESEIACVEREAWEELGVRVAVEGLILHQQNQPDETYQAFKTYRCRIVAGTPMPGSETPNPHDPSAGIIELGWVNLAAPIGINLIAIINKRHSYGIMELRYTMNQGVPMSIIPHVSDAMQTVLTTTTETIAATISYVKRPDQATFTPSTLVQTLVYGWLANPTASLGQLAQMAARVGATVSPQAIDRRFTRATANLLHHVLLASMEYAISADPVAVPILQRFTSVRIHDSTTIGLPDSLSTKYRGCGNDTARGTAGLKCGVQLDLLTGMLCGIDRVDGRASDQSLPVQRAPLPAGSLRLADLGFSNMRVFRERAAAEVYWLSRVQSHSRIRLPGQKERSILEVVTGLGDADHWEGTVLVGGQARLSARLLVQRVPDAVAAQRRQRVKDEAHGKRRPVSKDAMDLAAWTVVITNAPEDKLSLTEAMVLLKIRWQIELLFKLWKSHGHLDEWRTKNPARILCEIYAKLIGLVFQQWILAASAWDTAERSLFKAAQIVMTYAGDLASSHGCRERLGTVLMTLASVIGRLARVQKRQKRPSTAQRLLALTAGSG